MKHYDYVLVGSGLYAGVFAWYAKKSGKTCLVVEKRNHIGGNIYCEDVEGIHVHKYGATFSIPVIRRCGDLSTVWLSSTAIPTALWQTLRARCTTCLLI